MTTIYPSSLTNLSSSMSNTAPSQNPWSNESWEIHSHAIIVGIEKQYLELLTSDFPIPFFNVIFSNHLRIQMLLQNVWADWRMGSKWAVVKQEAGKWKKVLCWSCVYLITLNISGPNWGNAKSLMAANNATSLLLGNSSAFITTFSLITSVVNST